MSAKKTNGKDPNRFAAFDKAERQVLGAVMRMAIASFDVSAEAGAKNGELNEQEIAKLEDLIKRANWLLEELDPVDKL